ncbi:MAG: Crp/Fnr family transcriptional regulator [Vicingaceae bacterium]
MAEQSKLWYLESFNLFEHMGKVEMEMVEKQTKMKEITKGEFLYFPEDPSTSVFFLKKGRIKIGSYSEDGRESIRAVLQPGEIFGELALIGEGKRNDFAQAVDNEVLVCAMGIEDMERMMEGNTRLSLKVTKLLGLRLKRTETKLNDLLFKDARQRIIDFVKNLALEEGKKVGDEIMVKHPFTHQDIANLTASSRQTVTTVLNELKEQDLLYMERKKFLIRDLSKLK